MSSEKGKDPLNQLGNERQKVTDIVTLLVMAVHRWSLSVKSGGEPWRERNLENMEDVGEIPRSPPRTLSIPWFQTILPS